MLKRKKRARTDKGIITWNKRENNWIKGKTWKNRQKQRTREGEEDKNAEQRKKKSKQKRERELKVRKKI